ncbi:MAG: 2,3,4,5-tetrahydropyridine-2,6-dicarboxylate N-succinyltransferase [Chloroflexota bacterium]
MTTSVTIEDLASAVGTAFADPSRLDSPENRQAVEDTIAALDRGEIRLAEKPAERRDYVVNSWVQQAILLYFRLRQMETMNVGPFEYHDKIPLKRDYARLGVRVVPPAVARYGSFLEAGAILMPSYVNIGARVGSGTMVDTWATVGSGAQIGRDVHLAGGVGIGGVLEPPGARPVIVEDNAFIGSRCIVTEGLLIEEGAVLGANVTLTGSTPIIDVTGPEPKTYHGRVPARSVVVPGTRGRQFPAGEFQVGCALIVGQRTESTDRKTSLNNALRDFGVSV